MFNFLSKERSKSLHFMQTDRQTDRTTNYHNFVHAEQVRLNIQVIVQ